MSNIRIWISACRPRTLLLSASAILTGSGIALSENSFSPTIFILSLLTATSLQILSNLANDLGDFQHGTDTTGNRIGPQRATQSGQISVKSMKRGVLLSIITSLICGGTLLLDTTRYLSFEQIIIFSLLGVLSIIAAITYTAGKYPYGYIALGDLFSFLFFGPVAVIGCYVLHHKAWSISPLLPSIGMGCFSVLILNINNMRDIDNDIKSGKTTIAGKIGYTQAKLYHILITLVSIACFVLYENIYSSFTYQSLVLIALIPLLIFAKQIYQIQEKQFLDPFLRKTSISIFLFSILFFISRCHQILGVNI